MNEDILRRVFECDELADLDTAERRLALRSLILDQNLQCSVRELADWIDGWGPLNSLMEDPSVTDILVNGPREVWVERSGRLVCEGSLFEDPQQLARLTERMLGDSGAHADTSHPLASAQLVDGARIHVVLPPIAREGPLISIRKFPDRPLTLDDLLQRGMFDHEQADALTYAVERQNTIVISGGTGTGKTTLLNALLGCVGANERVVIVEETPELHPGCKHVVSMAARSANNEGRGQVDLDALVREALRMRPDRIVVGEVRGTEALAALTAMSTGHPGSMVTIHARSGPEALARLVALGLGARTGLSERAFRAAVEAAVDVTVHLERRGGERRVSAIDRLR